MLRRQARTGPVESFALVDPGQSDHEHHDIGIRGDPLGIGDQRLVRHRIQRVVPGGVVLRDTAVAQGVPRGVHPGRVHQRTAEPLETWVFGERADHCDAAIRGQREDAAVGEQDSALGGSAAGQFMMLLVVRVPDRTGGGPVDQVQDAIGARHHGLGGQLPGRHRGRHVAVRHSAAAGHLQVHPGVDSRHPVVGGAPIAHDEAVEAPLVAQDRSEQAVMVGAERPVDRVVRRHDRPRSRLGDSVFESRQVQLAQGAFVHHGVDHQPMGFLVVDREVFQARSHALALDTLDHRGGQPACHQGVLGQVLEVPAAVGVALDVEPWAQHNRYAFGGCLPAEGRSDLMQQGRVPRTGQGDGGRETRRRLAAGGAQVVPAHFLLAQSVRSVAEHH